MICEKCNKEITEKDGWIELPEIGIEIQNKVSNHGKMLADCMKDCPKGARLLTFTEALHIINKRKDVVKLLNLENGNNDFFIEQFIDGNCGKWVAALFINFGEFHVSGYYDLDYDGRARGVLFCKNIKSDKNAQNFKTIKRAIKLKTG